jgi:hypothetical protein
MVSDHIGSMSSRAILLLTSLGLAGCAQAGTVTLLSSTGIYSDEASGASLTLRSSVRLDRFASNARPAEAVIYICREYEGFSAAGRLVETAERNVYSANFPSISQRGVMRPDGQVTRGWPAELARANGICVHVEAAEMMWSTLSTNEIVVPQ